MATTLAINGKTKTITEEMAKQIPAWPATYDEVPAMLAEVYNSRKWSFNQSYEQQLCKEFAASHTAKQAVFMANGTVTLEAALSVLNVGPGDEVIVPGLTWMATAMAVLYTGATPVFADIQEDTWCLDPESVKKAITPKTKAIIPVHIYGSMADMEAMMDIAKKHNLYVIEDCAHAHGGLWDGKGVGSIGHVGSFSMQESKTLPSGEGGICTTNDADIADRIYRFKHIGYGRNIPQGQADSGPPEDLICHNYRGTEFQAVILLAGLKRLREQTEKRDANVKLFGKLIADVPGIKLQARGRKADLQGYYALGLRIDEAKLGLSKDRFAEALNAEGFPIGGTYGPVYNHILWNTPKSKYSMVAGGCPVCDSVCKSKSLLIMHYILLSDRPIIEAMAEAVHKVIEYKGEL